MANFTALKTAINNAIKTNGNEEITGAILQAILDAMVETLGDSAITDLENAITTEVTNRENAVGDVAADLAAEALARANKDNQLDGRINQEEYNRAIADAALSRTVDQGFQTLNSHMTALNAAISALNAAYQNGFLYGGIATPSSSPSNNKCFYIALQGGTYTNYGGVGVVEGINIIKNDSGWKVEHIYDQTTLLNEFYLLRQQVIQAITSFAPIVIEGDVTNAPDEEDLTSNANHLLQFKNNAYSPLEFSGLGRKYLRKNIAPLSESAPFNGFVEGVTAEETLSGTPTHIFWDRMNTRFVGIKDGVYYLDWTDSDNYVPVSTSLVYMYNGTPYQWTGSDFIVDETEVPNLVNCLTQDMINEANTIYIIRYDYTLKEDITIPANCVLQFDGGSIKGGNVTLSQYDTIKNGLFKEFGKITLASNNHIIDTTFDGLESNNAVIYGKNIENFTIENSEIIVNNENNNDNVCGILITGDSLLSGSRDINIVSCTFTGSKNTDAAYRDFMAAPLYVRYSTNVKVVSCHLTNSVKEGLVVQDSAEIIFSQNICHNSGYSGIVCNNSTNVLVDSNHVYDTGASCISTNCTNQIISNNTVHNNSSGGGICTGHGYSTEVYTRKCIVTGNIVENCHNNGISVSIAEELIITNNIIKHLSLSSSGTNYDGVNIVNIPATGDQSVKNKKIIISNNIIEDVYRGIALVGFKLSEGETDVVVSNNNISTTHNRGMLCICNYLMVSNNAFNNISQECIACAGTKIFIVDNKLSEGISIFGNNCKIDILNNIGEGYNKFLTFDPNNRVREESGGITANIRNNDYIIKINSSILIDFLDDYLNLSKTNLLNINQNRFGKTGSTPMDLTSDGIIRFPTGAYSSQNLYLKFLFNTLDSVLFIYHPISSSSYRPRLLSIEKGYRVIEKDTGKVMRWDGSNTWTEVDA